MLKEEVIQGAGFQSHGLQHGLGIFLVLLYRDLVGGEELVCTFKGSDQAQGANDCQNQAYFPGAIPPTISSRKKYSATLMVAI